MNLWIDIFWLCFEKLWPLLLQTLAITSCSFFCHLSLRPELSFRAFHYILSVCPLLFSIVHHFLYIFHFENVFPTYLLISLQRLSCRSGNLSSSMELFLDWFNSYNSIWFLLILSYSLRKFMILHFISLNGIVLTSVSCNFINWCLCGWVNVVRFVGFLCVFFWLFLIWVLSLVLEWCVVIIRVLNDIFFIKRWCIFISGRWWEAPAVLDLILGTWDDLDWRFGPCEGQLPTCLSSESALFSASLQPNCLLWSWHLPPVKVAAKVGPTSLGFLVWVCFPALLGFFLFLLFCFVYFCTLLGF